MNPAVRMERGYYLIDTNAWVDQRVGERADDFTAQLREFTDHDLFREQPTSMDVDSRVVLWCAARDWAVSEGAPIYHDDNQLTRPVSIILATAPGPETQAVAIVIVRGLIDHEGEDTTIAAVFGRDPQAPLRPCRACAAYDDSDTDLHCDCGGVSAIYCPVCGARCSLALPGIGTHQSRRRETP